MKRNKKIEDLELKIKNGTIVIASDIHIPFQDDKAVECFLNYCQTKQPEVIILNGDVLDMFRLSRFTKGEGRNPLEEMEICQELLSRLRNENPNADIYYIIGNHEMRLEKYVLDKAPELASLVEDVFSIIKVDKFNIKGCGRLLVNDNFLVKHGTLLGNKSGLSAIKEMENSYMSGASGHCHKAAKYICRKAGRKFIWLETGCLCDMQPEYMIDPNWQQAIAEIKIKNSKVYDAKILEIEDGKIL